MGLFGFLKKDINKVFVSPGSFEERATIQMNMSALVMDQLRKLNVDEQQELKLEYFFYTDTIPKADTLTQQLQKLQYEVQFGPSAGKKGLYLISGWTTKMKMDDDIVVAWTKQMCDLGYSFDCEFDGWGTTPDQ